MKPTTRPWRRSTELAGRLFVAITVTASGACDEGPRVEALVQTISFTSAPEPGVNDVTATVTATASSGLTVRYGTSTPSVCSVDAATGVVTAKAPGTCTVTASQPGDARFDAAFTVTQDVTFRFEGGLRLGAAPALAVHDQGTVVAVTDSGAPVAFRTATPSVCSVEGDTGLVTALAAGDCRVVASAGSDEASQVIEVSAPQTAAAPGAPTGVVATAGELPGTVRVRIGGVGAGGTPVTGYTVSSSPPGLTATSASLPLVVTCPSSCAGYRVMVTATNALGSSPPSSAAAVITRYRVVATFREPDTQPNDSVFVGTYTLDTSAGVVSELRGRLSESMTGGATAYPDDSMTWVPLEHQLSSVPVVLDGAQGWLVATFALATTNTLSPDPRYRGSDGWAPGSGMGLHYGYPGANPGNSYVRIHVGAADPTAAPTRAQLEALAYADCSPGGMMGASCMTGTSVAACGTVGTMGGYPLAQVTTRD